MEEAVIGPVHRIDELDVYLTPRGHVADTSLVMQAFNVSAVQ
jgi:hypothetical protein